MIRLALGDIIPEDDYLLRGSDRDGRLAEAVAERGVIVPLLVMGVREVKYQIVSGFRRLSAARLAGLETVPALVAGNGVSRQELFKTALLLNDPASYGDLDRAVIIAKAKDRFDFDWEEIEKFAPLAGLPPSPKLLQDYRAIGNFPESIRTRISSGALAFKTARALAALKPVDRDAIAAKIFAFCEWTASEGEEIVEWISDLARKEGTKIADRVDKEPLRQVLSEPNRSARERGRRLHEYLRRERFPLLTVWEGAFQKAKQKLEAEPGVALEKTAAFEEAYFNLKLQIASTEELRRLLEYLSRQEGLFKELFDRVK